jgi:hypothetical protein
MKIKIALYHDGVHEIDSIVEDIGDQPGLPLNNLPYLCEVDWLLSPGDTILVTEDKG